MDTGDDEVVGERGERSRRTGALRPGRAQRAGWQACTECGVAVVDVARHEAWHRRAERREQEVRQVGDELDYLRDQLLDQRAVPGDAERPGAHHQEVPPGGHQP